MAYIEGNTGKWEYIIGLEIHAQISSKSKLFQEVVLFCSKSKFAGFLC